MMNIGPAQLAIILAILVLLFGATRISNLGKGLGDGIRNFRRGLKGDEDEVPRLDKGS